MSDVCRIVIQHLIDYCNNRNLPVRTGNEPSIRAALNDLGVSANTALHNLYSSIIGPFTCNSDEKFPELLDVVSGDHNVVVFTSQIQARFDVPDGVLAISEIDSMVALLYDTKTDCVYEIQLDLEFEQFLNGSIKPRWNSSEDFLVEYFGHPKALYEI